MPDNNNDWLWEVEDEPASGGLSIEAQSAAANKNALESESAIKGLSLHLAKRTDDAIKELHKGIEGGQHLDELYAILGQVQFEGGKYEDAADAFAKLMDVEPRHRTGYYNLGVSLYRAGDRKQAALAFERAVNAQSDRPEARLGLALCRLEAGQHEHALDLFTKYIASGAVHPAALLGKAVCLHKTGKTAEAVEAYRRILAKNANSADALANLVAIGVESSNLKLVREFAERLAKIKPQSRVAQQGLATISIADGKWEAAARSLNELTKSGSADWETWYNLGIVCQKLDRRAEAVKALKESARLEPKSAEVQAALGVALQQNGDAAGARAAYEKGLQGAPGHIGCLWNMALLAENREDWDEAAILLSDLVGKKKDWPEAWFRLGYVQFKANEFKGSIEAFEKCLHLKPAWTEASANLAASLLAAGYKEAALEPLEKAAAGQQNNADLLRCLTSLTIELRQPQKAAEYGAKLEKLGDKNAELAYSLGWLMHDSLRYDDAANAYRRALELKPGFPEAELNLGHALKSLGRDEDARACFDRALAAKPSLAQR